MTHSTAARPSHAGAGAAPAPSRRIDKDALGAVAGIATILTVKISMLWAVLQPV